MKAARSLRLDRIDIDRPPHATGLRPHARLGNEAREQRVQRPAFATLKQQLHTVAPALAFHLRGRRPEHLDPPTLSGRADAPEERGDGRALRRFRAPHRKVRKRRPTRALPGVEREPCKRIVALGEQTGQERVRRVVSLDQHFAPGDDALGTPVPLRRSEK